MLLYELRRLRDRICFDYSKNRDMYKWPDEELNSPDQQSANNNNVSSFGPQWMHAAAFQVENRLFSWLAPTAKRVFSMKRATQKKVTPYLYSKACSTNGLRTRDKH